MNKHAKLTEITKLLSIGCDIEAERLFSLVQFELSESEREEYIGNCIFYARDYQRAIPHYEAAIKSDPNYGVARYHYLIGVDLERRGQMADAFRRYQAAIEIEPEFVDAYIELGGLVAKARDFEGAYKCFRDALKLDGGDIRIHHNLVEVLRQLSQTYPLRFGNELREAESRYAKIRQSAKLPDKENVW